MAIEREMKIFVGGDTTPLTKNATKEYEIIQFYIGDGIRINMNNKKSAKFCIKRHISGFDRHEFEYKIPFEDALALFDLHQGRFIHKKRSVLDKNTILPYFNNKYSEPITGLDLVGVEVTLDKFLSFHRTLNIIELEGDVLPEYIALGNKFQFYPVCILENLKTLEKSVARSIQSGHRVSNDLTNEMLVNYELENGKLIPTTVRPHPEHKERILTEFLSSIT